MTFSEINRLHLLTIVCVVASLGCYLFCVIFFNDYLHVSDLSFNNLLFIVAITGMSWGPLLFWKYSY